MLNFIIAINLVKIFNTKIIKQQDFFNVLWNIIKNNVHMLIEQIAFFKDSFFKIK